MRGLNKGQRTKDVNGQTLALGLGRLPGDQHRGTLVDKATRDQGGAGHEGLVHAVWIGCVRI